MLRASCLALALAAGVSLPAIAGGYQTVNWPELKAEIYDAREILPGGGLVSLEAPVRSMNDARVPVEIAARAPVGKEIRSLTLIVDENPMPVSAIFELAQPLTAARFGLDLRLNGPTPVRAVLETTDGQLYMREQFVKTSGLGACSAPPVGDPDAAVAAIGQMEAREAVAAAGASGMRRVRVEMRHPQHTGLQMDQVSLLFIPARFVDTVAVSAGGKPLFKMTGSISLAEDPALEFGLDDQATAVTVRLTDTDGTTVERRLPLGPEG